MTCTMASKFHKLCANTTGSTKLCVNSKIKSLKHNLGVKLHVCDVIRDRMSNKFNVSVCRICPL